MKGLHERRLSPDADNPREVAFAEQWEFANQRSDLVDHLMQVPCRSDDSGCVLYSINGPSKLPLGRATDHDRVLAATLMQWLGTKVGFGFLRDALSRCGIEMVKASDDKLPWWKRRI